MKLPSWAPNMRHPGSDKLHTGNDLSGEAAGTSSIPVAEMD